MKGRVLNRLMPVYKGPYFRCDLRRYRVKWREKFGLTVLARRTKKVIEASLDKEFGKCK